MRAYRSHLAVAVLSSSAFAASLAGCVAPTGEEPEPASKSADLIVKPCPACTLRPSVVAAPTGLATTEDPQVCAQHAPPLLGGLACEAALESGDVLLVWNWADTGVPSTDIDLGAPDGFHVYASFNGGAPTLWATQTSSAMTTIGVTAAPQGTTTCYTVTAYKGSVESAKTSKACVNGAGHPTTTVTLSPQELRTCTYDYDSNGNYFVTGPQTPPAGQFEVGYGMLDSSSILTGSITSFWDAEGAAYYDISAFKGHTIVSATLSFSADTSANCTNEVALSAVDWIDNSDLCASGIPQAGDSIATNFSPTQAAQGLDMTSAVISWSNGMPNLGILIPPNDPAQNNDYCNANYSAPQLTVTYFP